MNFEEKTHLEQLTDQSQNKPNEPGGDTGNTVPQTGPRTPLPGLHPL